MAVITERQAICEFLEAYKCLPCLWDQSDKLYTSKTARDQAYEILLEKYQTLQPDATLDIVRKKIDNMRSAYRREYKKVLEGQITGSEHHPKLWYYSKLTFLEKEWPSFAEDTGKAQYISGDEEETHLPEKLVFEEPTKKRIKVNNISFVDVQKEEDDDPVAKRITHESFVPAEDVHFEAESFGRTLGLQLKELSQMQRTIAEKLISEVIFYGRLDQLNLNSTLNVNDFS